MDKRFIALALGCFFIAPTLFSNCAHANGDRALILIPNELNQPLDIEPFTAHKGNSMTPMINVQKSDPTPSQDKNFRYKLTKADRSLDEKIMAIVPHSDKMKYLWDIADGDIDLYFEGLRGDRGNKGVAYKTKKLPFLGPFDSTEFKAEAGEDMALSFKTSSLPFGREIEGFNFKGSVGDEAKVSARYTIAFD